MTIAISLKVNDGLVLASDSASTIYDPTGQVIKVYNSANKIFNLRKGLPIGAITWGAGSIGPAAISTLAKDLRLRFSGLDPSHIEWALDPDKYALADVAGRVREFIFEELYVPVFQNQPVKPYLGFVVSGYSAGAAMAEEYEIVIAHGACDPPKLLRDKAACGVAWRGQPEAVRRLLLGYSHELASVLENSLAVPKTQLADALRIIQSK